VAFAALWKIAVRNNNLMMQSASEPHHRLGRKPGGATKQLKKETESQSA